MKVPRTLTIGKRMQVAKYPETIVGPFWGHSQLLQRRSCLKWKKKEFIKIILDATGTRGESKTRDGGQRISSERRMGYGM